MTPERLAEIRGIANTDYSVAHEEVLADTFAGTSRLIDALRELVPEYDSAKVYADRRTVEISELEAQIAGLVAELNGAKGRAQQADERAQRAGRRVPTSEQRARLSEFDSLKPGDTVGAKGEEYTVGDRDLSRDPVTIWTTSGNEYLLYPETWLGPFGWTLISRATETGHEALEEEKP